MTVADDLRAARLPIAERRALLEAVRIGAMMPDGVARVSAPKSIVQERIWESLRRRGLAILSNNRAGFYYPTEAGLRAIANEDTNDRD